MKKKFSGYSKKAYIEALKREKEIDTIKTYTEGNASALYCGIAVVLCRKHGWDEDDILDLYNDTIAAWNEKPEGMSMNEWCEKETGICIASPEMAKRMGD